MFICVADVFRIPQPTAHWYRNRQNMYKTVEIVCFTKVFQGIALRFVGLHLVL